MFENAVTNVLHSSCASSPKVYKTQSVVLFFNCMCVYESLPGCKRIIDDSFAVRERCVDTHTSTIVIYLGCWPEDEPHDRRHEPLRRAVRGADQHGQGFRGKKKVVLLALVQVCHTTMLFSNRKI